MQRLQFALALAQFVLQFFHRRQGIDGRRFQRPRDVLKQPLLVQRAQQRRFARDGLDAADARLAAAFGDDLEQAGLDCVPQVRPAAELQREVAHLHDAHDVAVLFAEQHHRAHLLGFFDVLLERVNVEVVQNLLVDQAFDLAGLAAGQRLVVREVEAQAVRGDQRAALLDMRAEDGLQGLVQQVRRRVVALDVGAARLVNLRVHRVADAQFAVA